MDVLISRFMVFGWGYFFVGGCLDPLSETPSQLSLTTSRCKGQLAKHPDSAQNPAKREEKARACENAVLDSWRSGCDNSRVNSATLAALLVLLVLTVVSVSVSINILLRGRIWQHLKPASRPRRWVLVLLLVSLAMTVVWLPVFVFYPRAPVARVFTVVWGFTFGGTCLTLKWLAGIVDLFYKRRGWPLR
jgi:hypothetical protein